jgi:hypothetical protein
MIVTLYFSLSLALRQIWGLEGICLAYALAWWITLGGAVVTLWRKGFLAGAPAPWETARYAACLGATGVVVWALRGALIVPLERAGWWTLSGRLSLTTLAAVLVFAWSSGSLLRVHELREFFTRLESLVHRRAAPQL